MDSPWALVLTGAIVGFALGSMYGDKAMPKLQESEQMQQFEQSEESEEMQQMQES